MREKGPFGRNDGHVRRLTNSLLVGAGIACGVLLSSWHAWATWPSGAVETMPGQMCPNFPTGYVIPQGYTPAQQAAAENTSRTFDCPFVSDSFHNAIDVVSITIDYYGATDANTQNCPNLPDYGLSALDQTVMQVLACRQSWTGSAASCLIGGVNGASGMISEDTIPSTLGQGSFSVPGFTYAAGNPYDYYYTEFLIDPCLSINLLGIRYDGTVDYLYN